MTYAITDLIIDEKVFICLLNLIIDRKVSVRINFKIMSILSYILVNDLDACTTCTKKKMLVKYHVIIKKF